MRTLCFGPRTAWAGLALHDVAGDQPIEQHPDRGQVLLDGRFGVRAAELLDVAGNVHRRHPGKIVQTSRRAPGREGLNGLEVGAAGMRVADVDGEKLPEAPSTLGQLLEQAGQPAGVRRRENLTHWGLPVATMTLGLLGTSGPGRTAA